MAAYLNTHSHSKCKRRNSLPSFSHFCSRSLSPCLGLLLVAFLLLGLAMPAHAQTFRFSLRADPDVIPANGISTSSILVQVQNTAGNAISAAPIVRFVTTDGTIESQTRLSGNVARVLLRSSTKAGTAVVTAFVGNAREQITVEFSDDVSGMSRYLDVQAASVSYGAESGIVTASGKCELNYGDTHIESDIRLDIDLNSDRIWAEGNSGTVLIRQGKGEKAHELRGDRLYYDFRRRRGVIRRIDTSTGPARQEFMGTDLRPIPASSAPDGGVSPAIQDKVTNAKHDAAITAVIPPDKTPVIDSTSRTTEPVAQIEPPSADPATPAEAASSEADKAPANKLEPTVNTPAQAEAATAETAVPAEQAEPKVEEALPHTSIMPSAQAIVPAGTENGTENTARALAPASSDIAIDPAARAAVEAMTATAVGAAAVDEPANPAKTTSLTAVYKMEGSRTFTDPAITGTPVTVGNALREPTKEGAGGEPQVAPTVPSFRPLDGTPDVGGMVFEPAPPVADVTNGYWVAARRLRVFPHDKIQFEKATLFLNGGKVFSMPRYVVPLNGIFNPGQDMLGFNSSGGLTLNVPFYYQASPNAQGTLYFQHAPGNGFAAEKSGFALALDQQYWLSNNSNGRLILDQLGRGNWNASLEHKFQLNPSTVANFSLDMPQHKDAYLRTSILKDFAKMQIGLEGFYTRPSEGHNDFQGQFFARMRPRTIGKSGWSYTLSANAAAWQRYPELVAVTTNVSTGGGVGLPGQTRPETTLAYRYRRAISQTVDLSLQAPVARLWRGATLNTTMRATAYNQSVGRRGLAPGLTLGFAQNFGRMGSMQLDYNYDKSGGLFTSANLTHSISGSLLFTPTRKIGANLFVTKSLSDRYVYASASMDYLIMKKWRIGLFSDYSSFDDSEGADFFDFGWTIGRMIGRREMTVNWSQQRKKIYFELGGFGL